MAAPGAEKRAAEAKAAAEKAAATAAEPAKDTKKTAPAAKTAGGRKSKDKWKAKEWYQKAKKRGNAAAKRALEALEKKEQAAAGNEPKA